MQIIPAINCLDLDCVLDKLRKAEKFSDWVHLDVADGRFTFNKTWGDVLLWPRLKPKINLEVHLMVEEPEKATPLWLEAGAKRLIVHLETISEKYLEDISARVKEHNAEIMLSSNPETPAENLKSFFDRISRFQVLAVYPGLAHQKFLPIVLEKIKFLRQNLPNAKIEVDGGINPETAKLCKEAGADIIVSASYIFSSENPEKAYQELCGI